MYVMLGMKYPLYAVFHARHEISHVYHVGHEISYVIGKIQKDDMLSWERRKMVVGRATSPKVKTKKEVNLNNHQVNPTSSWGSSNGRTKITRSR